MKQDLIFTILLDHRCIKADCAYRGLKSVNGFFGETVLASTYKPPAKEPGNSSNH